MTAVTIVSVITNHPGKEYVNKNISTGIKIPQKAMEPMVILLFPATRLLISPAAKAANPCDMAMIMKALLGRVLNQAVTTVASAVYNASGLGKRPSLIISAMTMMRAAVLSPVKIPKSGFKDGVRLVKQCKSTTI